MPARTRGFRTIHGRLFLLFLSCMLSLTLVVSAVYYKRTTDQVQGKIGEIARKNVSQTVELFDLLLEGYDSVSKTLIGNFDLYRLIRDRDKHDSAVSIINDRTITNMLGSVYFSRKDLIGIHVMTYAGKQYSYGNAMGVIDPAYAGTDWYRRIRESDGGMVWLGVHTGSLIDQAEKRTVFAFGRQLFELDEHRPIGVVLFEANPQPIVSALDNLSLGPNSETYIVVADGRIVAPAATVAADALRRVPMPPVRERESYVDRKPEGLTVAAKPTAADWTVVSFTPERDLNVELNRAKHFLLIVVSALVVAAIALATFVSRSISSPLKRVIQQMRQVERGNFRGTLDVKSYEEINILAASFNQMVGRMDELIERVKLSSTSEKNAQLQALQSQVNPHFLYNTLDMIYWMLDERGNDKLGGVVLSLSHLFRYSSHWDDAADVTLKEELEQITHYLTIIGTRLQGRLATDIQVEDRWLEARLPKMTLQPIIENAVKHGLDPLDPDRTGRLRVRTVASGRQLHIVIEDDGVGMEERTLACLRESLSMETDSNGEAAGAIAPAESAGGGPSEANAKRGIGLQNLHRRLVLMYGPEFGVAIDSKPGEGTTVTVAMPLPAQGEAGGKGENGR
ncbi:cache domain-containing sensor histidine kinase [Paenibacillus flagellatus]|uniref:histidine kinase n=1 Tax=Paenibacillus flagellatus TaxID=2211139 RepID=A0A2V5K9L2_9BACL|nr:sensor histidine kinase [Paenibacillus flagellatus]PYI56199.1 two-component sensor histidine kinase [Paenibacillus flagellatus]